MRADSLALQLRSSCLLPSCHTALTYFQFATSLYDKQRRLCCEETTRKQKEGIRAWRPAADTVPSLTCASRVGKTRLKHDEVGGGRSSGM